MNRYILGLLAFTFIDVFYTTVGVVYGGGGAEINPLFAQYNTPFTFLLVVILCKMFVISGVALLLWYLDERQDKNYTPWNRLVGIQANVTYAVLLLGALAANVVYQI